MAALARLRVCIGIFFKVYALDTKLDLLAGADKNALLEAMTDHILAEGIIMGLYQKKKTSI